MEYHGTLVEKALGKWGSQEIAKRFWADIKWHPFMGVDMKGTGKT